MKWFHRIAIGAAFSLIGITNAAGQEPLNLLFFGNSFSQSNVATKVGLLAVADGHPAPNLIADLQGGQTLDYHLSQVDNAPANNVNHPSIGDKTWDFVILQEYSTKPTHIGNPDDFRGDALRLYRRVRDHASGRGEGVEAVLFQTWARAPGHSFYPGSFSGPEEMQAELTANYAAALDDFIAAEGAGSARVAPVGEAFEARDFDLSLYGGDLYHQSAAGGLLASMVLYNTIYGENVSDIPFGNARIWAGVSQTMWESLAATADSLAIPEPAAFTLFLLGILGACQIRRRRIR